jgi:hypothetical protein
MGHDPSMSRLTVSPESYGPHFYPGLGRMGAASFNPLSFTMVTSHDSELLREKFYSNVHLISGPLGGRARVVVDIFRGRLKEAGCPLSEYSSS